jgi:hypothetical protein
MRTLTCERQSLFLLGTMAAFGVANLVFLVSVQAQLGFPPFLVAMTPVMVLYTVTALRGTLEALSTYRWNEEWVERSRPLRRERMRWADVRDFRIRRSTGDSSIFLMGGAGTKLRLDFQLLGPAGAHLLRFALGKLQPQLSAKLEAMERESRLFPRRHMGFIPLPGSVTAGGGRIRSGATELPIAAVRQVTVKEVKKLAATQEYVLEGDGGKVTFLSFVDDSPLLLRYLRAHVPEERWRLAASSGIFAAKLTTLLLVPVMAWAALMALADQAGNIATQRALAVRSVRAEATVVEVVPVDRRRFQVAYDFKLRDGQEGFGAVLAHGVQPQPGQKLHVRYDPQRPYYSLPEEGQGIGLPGVWAVLGPALVMLVISLPYAAAVLLFKVRDDPFAGWINAPPATESVPA